MRLPLQAHHVEMLRQPLMLPAAAILAAALSKRTAATRRTMPQHRRRATSVGRDWPERDEAGR